MWFKIREKADNRKIFIGDLDSGGSRKKILNSFKYVMWIFCFYRGGVYEFFIF